MSTWTRSAWTRREVLRLLPGQVLQSQRWTDRAGRFVMGLLGIDTRLPADPFSTLEIQFALGRVERHIAVLLQDNQRFARGHHLIAARLAYTGLLEQACLMAGIDPAALAEPDGETHPAVRQMRCEIELRSRGWDW